MFTHFCSLEKRGVVTPTITGRGTSLAAAFVHAIIPRKVDKAAQQALYERFSIDAGRCVYCGNAATDKDHLRAIVKMGKPSGSFHTIDNIVPACGNPRVVLIGVPG